MLTEREKEILNCVVAAWEEDGRLIGDCSYQEAFETLERLGLMKPQKLMDELDSLERFGVPDA